MKYCTHCGAPLNDGDSFCAKCGAKTGETTSRQEDANGGIFRPEIEVTAKDRLVWELAYSGVLFWLPLLVSPKAEHSKYHANQGLWMLIVACLLCWVIRILRTVKEFFESNAFSVVFNVLYSMLFAIFLMAMFYLALQGIKRVLAIHRGETPESILFFEDKAIIH